MAELSGAEACGQCGGRTFRVTAGALACAGCGHPHAAAESGGLLEMRLELAAIREELARLRQAVNFLNQRVR